MSDENQQHDETQYQSELKTCQQKAEEYLNSWKRERADFLNYKKDEVKRLEEFVKFANEAIILEVIEVLDDLEQAAKEINNDGLNQVLKKFQDLLDKYDLKRITVEGEKFNPLIHEAVIEEMQNEEEKVEKKEEKLKEIRAGYTMHGRVIRPARVRITK